MHILTKPGIHDTALSGFITAARTVHAAAARP
jgi:hypothetical protein